jgi:hypothetical protein
MALNVGLDASSDNTYNCKGTREKAEEANNDTTSLLIQRVLQQRSTKSKAYKVIQFYVHYEIWSSRTDQLGSSGNNSDLYSEGINSNLGRGHRYSEVLRGFHQSIEANAETEPSTNPISLRSTSSQIHYSLSLSQDVAGLMIVR